ncbi:MAG: SDR family oxidoreductase [Fimbriimonadaceae bacterium]|nr:SDR family oxidoreductase [Fimbriimonadaceae bacterium]QYK57945.1 MAG: SDR family oxidoreductase [Fimbriimonadaceae bacterium]
MDLGLHGKVAMVAAATQGIGLACARELAAEGCRVSVCSRSPVGGELGDGIRAYSCDVSDPAQIEAWLAATFKDLGAPEILVTNTGGPPAGLWEDMSDDQWATGVESTLMSAVRMARMVAPLMRARGWGRIVHLTSLAAKEPNRILAVSSTLRSGLMALTRLQASELARFGVTVNAVLPGHTMTDRQVHLAELRAERDGTTVEQALAAQAASVPMGRLAQPREIAAAVAFLCSDRASYVTGVNLLVDGGSVQGLA